MADLSPLGIGIVNSLETQESTIRYYSNRQGLVVWNALVVFVGFISMGASFAAHSVTLTSGLLLGSIAVWYLGHWFLSKSHYFMSSSKAGFKDAFRTREVQFDEVRAVTKSTGRYSSTLNFACDVRTVTMPLDPLDDSWFSDVRTELHSRGISISTRVFGMELKGE